MGAQFSGASPIYIEPAHTYKHYVFEQYISSSGDEQNNVVDDDYNVGDQSKHQSNDGQYEGNANLHDTLLQVRTIQSLQCNTYTHVYTLRLSDYFT